MGNCDSRNYPTDSNSPEWKRCGYYNDWITDDNFCMPPTQGGDKDAKFCNSIGGHGEWKVRTPSYQQSEDNFITGGGNTPIQINQAINAISTNRIDVMRRQDLSGALFNDERFQNMRDGGFDSYLYHTSDNKDMGPLYATDLDGNAIALWDNWLNTHGYNDELPNCTYDSWRAENVQTVGCCSKHYSSCGIVGGINISCIRNEFAANKNEYGDIACCFNDLVCEPGAQDSDRPFAPHLGDGTKTAWAGNQKCFRSGRADDNRTCKPESRNLGGMFCADTLKDYCTGDKLFPGQANWLDSWDTNVYVNVNEEDSELDGKDRAINVKGPCVKALMRQLSGKSACGEDFNTDYVLNYGSANESGLLWGSEVIEKVFHKYFAQFGSPLLGPNEDGIEASTGSQSFLYDLCRKIPTLCVNALTTMCNQMTEDKLAANPLANKWCGCYMSEEFYTKYSDGSFLVTPECTPFCSRLDTIPRVDTNGNPKYCEQSICIINNTVLDLVDTQGNVEFNEVCPRCGHSENRFSAQGSTTQSGGVGNRVTNSVTNSSNSSIATSCQCKLDNTTFTAIDAKFRNLKLGTNCGGSQCTNDQGDQVACASNTNQILPSIENSIDLLKKQHISSKFKKILIIFVSIILLGGLFFVMFVYRKRFFHSNKGFVNVNPGDTYSYNNNSLG